MVLGLRLLIILLVRGDFVLLCAALKLANLNDEDDFIVISCWRHGYGFETVRMLKDEYTSGRKIVEGFITTDNKFLDRTDALSYAYECGQISQAGRWYKQDNKEIELYSEDLY